MKSRYVLVNETEKYRFETKWQLPYGFSQCPVTTNSDDILSWKESVSFLDPDIEWSILSIDDYGNHYPLKISLRSRELVIDEQEVAGKYFKIF